jgi:hypothetical protein
MPAPRHMARLFSLVLLPALTTTAALAQTTTTPDASTAIAPPSLGRLFFTPETRAALDRQRASSRLATGGLQGSTLTLNGTVLRSSGKRTYWINGHPQPGDALPQGLVARTSRSSPGQTTFRLDGEHATTLRVGESATRNGDGPEASSPSAIEARRSHPSRPQ